MSNIHAGRSINVANCSFEVYSLLALLSGGEYLDGHFSETSGPKKKEQVKQKTLTEPRFRILCENEPEASSWIKTKPLGRLVQRSGGEDQLTSRAGPVLIWGQNRR